MKKRNVMVIVGVVAFSLVAGVGSYATRKMSNGVMAASVGRQVESLNRGLTGVKTGNGILLSWRLLGTESYNTTFNVYRDGKQIASNIAKCTNYLDKSGTVSNEYYVTSVVNGNETTNSNKIKSWSSNYLDVAINKPAAGSNKSGSYTYSANDASVGDVDGDGEYEIILKWDPSNSKDNSQSGYTGNTYIDCYKMNGKQLWRIDLGCNVRAGAHYSPFLVYDFDGDGKSEVVCRTAYGSKDGTGEYVNSSSDGLNSKDYRNSKGYILTGTEFLTVFNGKTGDTMQTIEYTPQRGTVKSWGDSYGNRVDRFLAGVAYCDGKTPYIIMCRGYYTRAVIVAYSWNGSKLTKQWCYDTGSSTSKTASAYGQGAHSLSIADADNDGYDEIIYGSAVIDNNGSLLYSTGHGHGDALHVNDFNNDGKQEVYMVHEEKSSYTKYGAELRDAATGKVLACVGASADVGRGLMANITSSSGSEFWSTSDSNLYSISGSNIGSRPSSVNFSILWDGDLYSELLDGTAVSKYNESTKKTDTILKFANVHSNNTTKATPCLQADIFGDYREEVIMGGDNDTFLRIYTTDKETDSKLYTLMHDTQYRTAIAWQNAGYNQPPHTSYYIGEDMSTPKQPSVYTAGEEKTPAATVKPTAAATVKPTAAATVKPTEYPSVTVKPDTSNSETTSKGWNFKTSAFRNLGTLTKSTEVSGLTITASESKTVKIIKDTATVGNLDFTYSLALGGAGNTNYRSLKVPVTKGCVVKVFLRSNNTSTERSLIVADANGNKLSTITAPTTATLNTYEYTGDNGFIYLYSSNSGINIYKVEVVQ